MPNQKGLFFVCVLSFVAWMCAADTSSSYLSSVFDDTTVSSAPSALETMPGSTSSKETYESLSVIDGDDMLRAARLAETAKRAAKGAQATSEVLPDWEGHGEAANPSPPQQDEESATHKVAAIAGGLSGAGVAAAVAIGFLVWRSHYPSDRPPKPDISIAHPPDFDPHEEDLSQWETRQKALDASVKEFGTNSLQNLEKTWSAASSSSSSTGQSLSKTSQEQNSVGGSTTPRHQTTERTACQQDYAATTAFLQRARKTMATNSRQQPDAYPDKTIVPLNIFDQQTSGSSAEHTPLSTAILARIDAALHAEDARSSSVAESSDDVVMQKAAAQVVLQRAIHALANAAEDSSAAILYQLNSIADATRSSGAYSDDKVYLREEQKATIIALRELNTIARETQGQPSMIPEHVSFMDARLSRRTSIELQKMIHELRTSNVELIASLARPHASPRHDEAAGTSTSSDSTRRMKNYPFIPEPEQQPNGTSRRAEKRKLATPDETFGTTPASPPSTFIGKLVRQRQRPTSDLEAAGEPGSDPTRVPLNLHATVVHRAADAVMRRRGTDHLQGLAKFLHYPRNVETEPVDPARVPVEQRVLNNKPLTPFDLPPTAYLPLQNTPFRLVSRQSVMDDPVLRHGVHDNAGY